MGILDGLFYGICGERVKVSPDGKLLPPPLDIRNTRRVTSALLAFRGCKGEGAISVRGRECAVRHLN